MDARSTGVILNRESHSEVRSSHLFYASNFQTQSQTVIVSPSAPVFTTHDQNIIADVNASPRPSAFNIPQQGQGEAAWTVHGQSPRDPIAPSEPPPPYSEVDKLPSALPATNPPAYRQHENSTMAHAQHTTSMGSVTQKPFKLKKAYLKSNLAVLKVLEFVSLIWCLSFTLDSRIYCYVLHMAMACGICEHLIHAGWLPGKKSISFTNIFV